MASARDPKWQNRRVQLGLAMVPVVLAGWVVGGVLHARTPAPLPVEGEARYGMTASQRLELFGDLAKHEAKWRRAGQRKFAARPWSADDDFHWHVQAHIERKLAKQHKLPASHVWALYDEAVHGRWVAGQHRARVFGRAPASARRRPTKRAAARGGPKANRGAAFRASVPPLRPRVF